MATAKQIADTILDLAGNPETGPVKELAQSWAEAIVRLDNPVNEDPSLTIEKRVVAPDEIR